MLQRRQPNWSPPSLSQRRLTLLMSALLVLVLLTPAVTIPLSLNTLHDIDHQHNQVDPMQTATTSLLLGAVNQETALRGFLLSGDPSFLQPFPSGSDEASASLRTLRSNPLDPVEAERVSSAASSYSAWRSYATRLVNESRSGQGLAALASERLGNGKTLFNTFRHRQSELQASVQAAVSDNQAAVRRTVEVTLIVCIVLTALVVGGIALLWWLTRRWIHRDVTSQAALREAAILTDTIINSADVSIFAKDAGGRYLLANRASALAMTGRPDTEMTGRRDAELVDPDVVARLEADDQAVMASGRSQQLEEVLLADGVERTYETTKTPLRNAYGSVVGLVGVARDVTEERELARRELELFEAEHRLASRVQEAMLGTAESHDDRIDVYAYYRPASEQLRIGGDWFDVVSLGDGRTGLIVGDVVGHGIESAVAMGQLRSALVGAALASREPDHVLDAVESFAHADEGAFSATCLYCLVDPASGKLTWSNAGHPPALVVAPEGGSFFVEGALGPPLAASRKRVPRRRADVEVAPGSLLVLYTDGLVERRGESLDTGLRRLERSLVANRSRAVPRVCESLLEELVPGDSRDDVVLMVARLMDGDRDFHREVPAEPSALRPLRHQLSDWLNTHFHGGDTHAIVLAVSEALTNVVEHAYATGAPGPVRLSAYMSGTTLTVRVSDGGAWRHEPPGPVRGRGLQLMRALMDHVQVDKSDRGTVVRLEKILQPAGVDDG